MGDKTLASPFRQMTTTPAGEEILTGMKFEFDVRTVVETCKKRWVRVLVYHRMELFWTERLKIPRDGTDMERALINAKGRCEAIYRKHLPEFNVEEKQEALPLGDEQPARTAEAVPA